MNAEKVLDAANRRRIEQAIGAAEQHSAVDIVCALASESGRYERAGATLGLLMGLLALFCVEPFYLALTTEAGQWGVGRPPVAWYALAVVSGFVAGNLLAEHVHPLRRLFVSELQGTRNAERGASHAFVLAAVANTGQRTGLLIYISLFERRVVIRADQRAHEALGDEWIGRLRDLAVDRLRQGDIAGAFTGAIEQAAPRLAVSLPAERSLTARALADHLLVLHPRPSFFDLSAPGATAR